MTGVLLGGRRPPVTRSPLLFLAFVWLPVAFMLLVIARESTEAFASLHTSAILRPVYQAIFGPVADERWDVIHHLLRKTGHFLGYGTLGLTWLRAWLYTWLVPLRHSAVAWRSLAWRMAIACTAVTAALDELHQTWIPDRTGMMSDVVLDTVGALVLCSTVALVWRLWPRPTSEGPAPRSGPLAAD